MKFLKKVMAERSLETLEKGSELAQGLYDLAGKIHGQQGEPWKKVYSKISEALSLLSEHGLLLEADDEL